MDKVLIIIPARYASTRFPGKPLALLGGKPIIQWVVEQAERTGAQVVVATDDKRIAEVVQDFGGRYVMTSPKHQTGTERIIEAYHNLGSDAEIVINLQGDEPFVSPEQITSLIEAFAHPSTEIATLAEAYPKTTSNEELTQPHSVKVVYGSEGFALYFSRLPIPYLRGVENHWCSKHTYYKHIGLYGFRASILPKLQTLAPAPSEQAESLEQLRWLEAGYHIRVMPTEHSTIGIDTPEDLERATQYILARQSSN